MLSINGILNDRADELFPKLNLAHFQVKSLKHISHCRTQALGGHAQYCEQGHLSGVWYNSCKQRGCPRCQSMATEQWLQNTSSLLLACPHHHIIFTIPSQLNELWRFNRELLSDILFKASHDTIKVFAKGPRYLNAMPGILSVLHTWGRNLSLHPHIHMLVSHGGFNQEGQWIEPKKKHLFPQKPVMMVFRGKLLARLRQALDHVSFVLPTGEPKQKTLNLLNKLGRKDWTVHFCQRYNTAQGVAKYLARYIKRGPLNNTQIKQSEGGMVTFQYRSHQTKRIESQRLSEEAFFTLYAQHSALPGKPSVRYGGLYVSSVRDKLNLARQQLKQPPVAVRQVLSWEDYWDGLGGKLRCTKCDALIVKTGPIPEKA